MTKVVFGFGIILLNIMLSSVLDKPLKKVNILNITNFKIIPEWLKGIICLILILLTCPAFTILITSGFVLYDFIIDKDIYNIILTIILTIVSNMYINIIKIGK